MMVDLFSYILGLGSGVLLSLLVLEYVKFVRRRRVEEAAEPINHNRIDYPKPPLPPKKPMVFSKDWEEFRETGMLAFINMILHFFGWAIAVDVNDEGKAIKAAPARVKFRGFSEDITTETHLKVSEYLKKTADELYSEIRTTDEDVQR